MTRTMGWRHENGLAAEKKAGLREERLEKEDASAKAVAQQLRDQGLASVTIRQPNGSVVIRLHKYLHITFRYRTSSMAFQPCDGVALVSSTPPRYKMRKLVRNYKLDWVQDPPALLSPARAVSAAKTCLGQIEHAEITCVRADQERRKFGGLVRGSVEEAGFQFDDGLGSGVVYLTAESDIRSKGRSPAFQVHQAITEDRAAHMLLKCRIPPEKVGVLAAKLNELVLEHELTLM